MDKNQVDTIKVMVIGDTHIKKNELNIIDLYTERVLEAIDKTNPDFVVHLGDLLNDHQIVDQYCLDKAIEFLKQVSLKKKLYL